MPAMKCSGLLALALVAIFQAAPAAAFEHAHADPAFLVRVPGLPDAGLRVEVRAEADPARSDSTRLCAGTVLRELVKRPGMPDRDRIYRAPLDVQTFLVLYVLDAAGGSVVHAHLLAALTGTHCVDVHLSRPLAPDESPEDWRAAFAGARILPGAGR